MRDLVNLNFKRDKNETVGGEFKAPNEWCRLIKNVVFFFLTPFDLNIKLRLFIYTAKPPPVKIGSPGLQKTLSDFEPLSFEDQSTRSRWCFFVLPVCMHHHHTIAPLSLELKTERPDVPAF